MLTRQSATRMLMTMWLALDANGLSKSLRSEKGISRRIGCKEEGRSCECIVYTAYPPPSGPPQLLPPLPLWLGGPLSHLARRSAAQPRAKRKRERILFRYGPLLLTYHYSALFLRIATVISTVAAEPTWLRSSQGAIGGTLDRNWLPHSRVTKFSIKFSLTQFLACACRHGV